MTRMTTIQSSLPANPRSRRRTMRTATSSQTTIHTTSAAAANPSPKVYASGATAVGSLPAESEPVQRGGAPLGSGVELRPTGAEDQERGETNARRAGTPALRTPPASAKRID